MSINKNNPDLWKQDIAQSVDFFNHWFLTFAPKAFREIRIQTTKEVETAFKKTEDFLNLTASSLAENPGLLPMLRMSTCPPIARDRLIGLANTSPGLVYLMEKGKLPSKMSVIDLDEELTKICATLQKLIDPDIITWFGSKLKPNTQDVERASTIIADRLCGSVANPIIRNAQEKRQLSSLQIWLEKRNYRKLNAGEVKDFREFPEGTFDFHFNVPVNLNQQNTVNIPIDIVIKPIKGENVNFPVLIEAKSAGDFTNVNKRRKEEAAKMFQLKKTYGNEIQLILFLCGFFDSGYLGYEAAEGIDWVWEHRIDDLLKAGL